jgi:hypothetical protein
MCRTESMVLWKDGRGMPTSFVDGRFIAGVAGNELYINAGRKR